ncbi:MAG: response regulator [Acidimicrobiales bacterium]
MGTIVVASDAPSVRATVAAALGEPGTEIVEVRSGPDVAPAVDEHEPDLVVVDMQMGNMGAMAVCMDLRLEASYDNLPAVAVLMLLDRRADVFLARRCGAEGWLVKPLDSLRLRKAATALSEGGTYHDQTFQPVPSSLAPDLPLAPDAPAGGVAPAGTDTDASSGGA